MSALVGSWGSGKSWLLQEIKARIIQSNTKVADNQISVRSFNPWLYSDEDSLFAGFAQLLLGEIARRKVRNRVAKGLEIIGPSLKFGAIDLSDATSSLAGALTYALDPQSIQSSIRKALRRSEKRILVVLDDLDRLTPDELLMTFKLVRLLGDIGGIHYLLVYDEDTILHLLASTPIAAANAGRARSYLEKIVSKKFSIPPMLPSQINALGLERILEEARALGVPLPVESISRFEWNFDQIMRTLLSTPRALDQYFGEVFALPAELFQEIDFSDWCGSTFLRISFPDVWKLILEYRNALTGNSEPYADADEGAVSAFETAVEKLVVNRTQLQSVIDLLAALFPQSGLKYRRVPTGGPSRESLAANRRIGDSRFFERYLWLSLPPGDISDGAITAALRGISQLDPTETNFQTFGKLLESAPLDVIDRIRFLVPSPGISLPSIIRYVSVHAPFNDLASIYAGSGLSTAIYRIISMLESSASEDDVALIRAEALSLPLAKNSLWFEIVRRHRDGVNDVVDNALLDVKNHILDLIGDQLGEFPTPGELSQAQAIGFHFFRYSRHDQFIEIARRQVDDGKWRADDTLGLALAVWTGSGGQRIDSLSTEDIQAVFGVEFLKDRDQTLRSEEAEWTGSLPENWTLDGLPPTVENRRLIVHAAVRKILADHVPGLDSA
ncbi:hypothetical protein GCM10011399_17470 [Subtercola lobariae]|uniref:KAP NTPase domain-containing protein n=1 Tax=Subtercola lobariae TaxID=1588641 RepID=A0A917B560_9MICO|nr:hypothetical protein GCM10011399_17470 [Subtercola lobariae]